MSLKTKLNLISTKLLTILIYKKWKTKQNESMDFSKEKNQFRMILSKLS